MRGTHRYRSQRHKDEHTVPSTVPEARSEIRELSFLTGGAMRGKHDARSPRAIFVILATLIKAGTRWAMIRISGLECRNRNQI
jgi:hypothetical protein